MWREVEKNISKAEWGFLGDDAAEVKIKTCKGLQWDTLKGSHDSYNPADPCLLLAVVTSTAVPSHYCLSKNILFCFVSFLCELLWEVLFYSSYIVFCVLLLEFSFCYFLKLQVLLTSLGRHTIMVWPSTNLWAWIYPQSLEDLWD